MSLKDFMMLVLSLLLVTGVVLAGGCALTKIETPKQETPTKIIEHISPQDASTLIQENQNNPGFVIIDVRTPEEFAEGYIENAINIDFYAETFRDDIYQLDKNKTYLIYCRSGRRSADALGIKAEFGFTEVYNLLGGIIDWKAAGLPFTK